MKIIATINLDIDQPENPETIRKIAEHHINNLKHTFDEALAEWISKTPTIDIDFYQQTLCDVS